MNPLFCLTDIEFAYVPGAPVLNGASLTLAPGDRVALTGGNGAGKTTLLRVMAGLIKPQGGNVHAFGKLRRSERDFHEVRLRTGLMMSDPGAQLFCATVAEDVAFGPFNLGWPHARVQAAVDVVLEQTGLTSCRDRAPSTLSHGEQRMAALATLLVMEPEVLLLDEPAAGLDAAHSETMAALLTTSRATLLMASHDEVFLNRIAARWLRLDRGRLLDCPRPSPKSAEPAESRPRDKQATTQ